MAGEPVIPGLVAGVRIPGAHRLRFYRTAIVDIALRDWVPAPSPAGEEPGLVVVAPQQLKLAGVPDHLPVITKRLAAAEVEQLAARLERVRGLLDDLIAVVRDAELPLFITGLRFTLNGEAAIVSYRGSEAAREDALIRAAEPVVGVPVQLEYEGAGPNLFGGLGRPPAGMTFHDLLRNRFSEVGGAPAFAPEGLVRLGTRVGTAQGAGMVISVATRERQARVRLDTGEEVLLPVDGLSAAG